jgi:hypothetical protein
VSTEAGAAQQEFPLFVLPNSELGTPITSARFPRTTIKNTANSDEMSSKMISRRQHLFWNVETIVAFALLIAVYSHDIDKVEFHGDESGWISLSSQFEAFHKRQFSSPLWSETYWTLTQPPMARYLIGISRRIGGFHADELNYPYDFSQNFNYNVKQHLVPVRGLLWWSRLGMSVLAAGSMLVGFVLLLRAWGRPAAYSWLLLCSTSAYFLLHLRRAMGESPVLFFVALSLVSGFLALTCAERRSANRSLLWFSCMGVCIGLAASSKLNGGSVIVAAAVLAILAAWKAFSSRTERLRYAAKALAILALTSGLTFTAAYPFLWRDPVHRTVQMLGQRVTEMRTQQRLFRTVALDSPEERIKFLSKSIVENTASTDLVGWPGTLGLAVLGLTAAISGAMKWIRRKSEDPVAVVLVTVGLAASAPVAGTLLQWERYELFPVFTISLFVCVGAGLAFGRIYEFVAEHLSPLQERSESD